jgi:DNA-binding CsgD family transcriptional regulator
VVDHACQIAGLPEAVCHREDRGDGLFLIPPPCVSAEILLDTVANHLRAGLRRHNRLSSAQAQIRLRMAVHAGEVQFDANGVSGTALVRLFRILNAEEFKDAFNASEAEFALISSDRLYDDMIRHAPGLIDPDLYRPIAITLKETRTQGWVWLASAAGGSSTTAKRPSDLELTASDIQTACLIVGDAPRDQLAKRLAISIRDIDAHIAGVIAKFGLANPRDVAAAFVGRLQQARRESRRTPAMVGNPDRPSAS